MGQCCCRNRKDDGTEMNPLANSSPLTAPPRTRARKWCTQCLKSTNQLLLLFTKVNIGYLIVVLLILLTSAASFSASLTLTTLMSKAVHLNDSQSTFVYGLYGIAATVWAIIGGPLLDRLGFKVILILACLLGAAGRFLVATLVTSHAVYVALFGLMAFGEAWSRLALNGAMLKYVPNDALRKFLFGVNYAIMNIGAIIAGILFDTQPKIMMLENTTLVVDNVSQSIFVISGLFMLAAFVVSTATLCVHCWATMHLDQKHQQGLVPPSPRFDEVSVTKRKSDKRKARFGDVEPLDSDEERELDELHKTEAGPILPEDLPPQNVRCGWLAAISSKSFWRVAVFSFLCFGARSVFLQIESTFPTIMARLYGPAAPMGTMFIINPLMIIGLAPLLQLLVIRSRTITVIIIGTFISATSILALYFAYPSSMGMSAFVLFSVILSIGEGLWSPLSTFYITQIAGRERVGTYLTVTSLIDFLPRMPTAYLSGVMLSSFCPSDNVTIPCNVSIIAISMFALAISTPILLVVVVFFGFLRNVPIASIPTNNQGLDYDTVDAKPNPTPIESSVKLEASSSSEELSIKPRVVPVPDMTKLDAVATQLSHDSTHFRRQQSVYAAFTPVKTPSLEPVDTNPFGNT